MSETFTRDDEGWVYNPDARLDVHPWPIWRYIGYPNTGHEALIARDGNVIRVRMAAVKEQKS